ncbi:MAG: ATP-dependent Clp protease proteolytic subunit [Bacteroidales bacterium]|jgi:ATP-dependent Clp protease protease subunit|nr:ATP-dependent Clp protease proteolytic subunit [Bacteroidales bacterium]
MNNEFYKFATCNAGVNGHMLDDYMRFQSKTLQPRASYINPSIIEERQLNVAQMDVFSRLMMDRIIFLGTEIDEYSANVVQAQLLFLASAEGDKDVVMYLNSPGGIVSGGLAIYDTMNYISCDVSTVVTGMAASMASVLLAAGTKGKRFALPHSRVMIHQPLGGTQGQASDMEIAVNEIKKLKGELYQILADCTNQPIDRIERDCDRDHYLTATEALEYGMIDKIFEKKR